LLVSVLSEINHSTHIFFLYPETKFFYFIIYLQAQLTSEILTIFLNSI